MKLSAHKNQKGFTLIELLVVIGILAVLLAIVLIAINPARQFSQANDTKRRSDINAILNAVHQYAADNRGNIVALNITTVAQNVASDPSAEALTGTAFCTNLVPTYIAGLPTDPTTGTIDGAASNGNPVLQANCASACTGTGATCWDTGYVISSSSTDNRITVSASGELVTDISVTR